MSNIGVIDYSAHCFNYNFIEKLGAIYMRRLHTNRGQFVSVVNFQMFCAGEVISY